MPPCDLATPLDRTLALPIPLNLTLFPLGGWVDEDLIEGGLAFANDPGLAPFGSLFHWKKCVVKGIIKLTRRDEGHGALRTVQPQCEATVRAIAHHTDLAIGEPSMHRTDHLLCPHGTRFVPLACRQTEGRGRRKHDEKGDGPALGGPGWRHDHGHHDPA